MQDFLPVTKKEMQQRGWDQVDFVYLTGDAYVDHPSFGAADHIKTSGKQGLSCGDHSTARLA